MSNEVYPQSARRHVLRFPWRDYQEEAIERSLAAIERGARRILIVVATGGGKTLIFSEIIARRPGRALILVHRDELLTQAVDKLRMIWPDADIGIVKAADDQVDAQVVIASVQTLARDRRLQRLVASGPFGTVVVDEAHHATAATYIGIFEATGAGQPDGPVLVGVTATPDRGDGQGLDAVFDLITYEIGILDLIERQHLSDIRAVRVHFEADASQLKTVAGEISESSAADWFESGGGPAAVGAATATYAADRQRILVYCPNVKTAYATAATIRAHGITAEAIDGATPLEERRDILRRFSSGEIRVLVNCQLLTEGFDMPSVDCIVLARPTKSRGLYAQMVGRGTRRHPGKDDLLVLDLAGATGRHDLASAASLFGLDDGELVDGEEITRAVGRKRAREAAVAAAQLLTVTLEAHVVSAFRSRPARWISTSGGRYVLPAGAKHVVLAPDPANADLWSATLTAGGYAVGQQLVSGVTLEMATGLAEDHARAAGAAALIDPNAAWRAKPATDKQMTFARSLGIEFPTDISSGDLSDRISAARVAGVA